MLALVGALALFDVGLTAGAATAAETASSAPLRAGKATSACTANFLVHKNGTYMNLAAGHCGTVGATVTLGGAAVGTVQVSAFSKGTDAAAFTVADGASLAPSVFVSSTLVRPVVGQGTAAVGDKVCMRGAASAKEVCGTVRSVGASLTYLNTAMSGLVRVTLEGGPLISGDSGAPVYKVGADGSAYAVGIAVLSDGTFTSISAALSATGTALVTKPGGATPNNPAPEQSPTPTPTPTPTPAALKSRPAAVKITAPSGTPNDPTSLGLPATITVPTDRGDKQLPVTWEIGSVTYDPASPTEQTVTYRGVVQLPEDVANPSNLPLDVEATVTVLAAHAEQPPATAAVPPPPAAEPVPATKSSGSPLAMPLAAAGVALVLCCAATGIVMLRRRGLI